jgi:endo-1,4-beta-mannosidase
MRSKWEAQNILTRSITYDILGVLIMDMVNWYNKTKSMGWKNQFFTWFGVNYPSNINDDEMEGRKYLN